MKVEDKDINLGVDHDAKVIVRGDFTVVSDDSTTVTDDNKAFVINKTFAYSYKPFTVDNHSGTMFGIRGNYIKDNGDKTRGNYFRAVTSDDPEQDAIRYSGRNNK